MSRLTRIFALVLNIDETKVTPEMSPQNTSSWDSLNAIILITEIEKAFNIKFSYDEAMGVKDFAGVLKLVASKGGEVDE